MGIKHRAHRKRLESSCSQKFENEDENRIEQRYGQHTAYDFLFISPSGPRPQGLIFSRRSRTRDGEFYKGAVEVLEAGCQAA